MTVPNEINRNEYTGNGVTTAFPYTFRILQQEDLAVYVQADADADVIQQTLGTDYSVDGVDSYSGGNVTFLAGAVADGATVIIVRNVEATQTLDLRNQGPFLAETIERELDKLTMLIQQVRQQIANPASAGGDSHVALSAADATPGYLDDKLDVGQGLAVADADGVRVVSHAEQGDTASAVTFKDRDGNVLGNVAFDALGHGLGASKDVVVPGGVPSGADSGQYVLTLENGTVAWKKQTPEVAGTVGVLAWVNFDMKNNVISGSLNVDHVTMDGSLATVYFIDDLPSAYAAIVTRGYVADHTGSAPFVTETDPSFVSFEAWEGSNGFSLVCVGAPA